MSRDRNAGRGHSVKTDNTSIERMEEFKYLGTTITDQNSIPEEIKSRLKLGNVCYHSVQNLLSSRLLSKTYISRYIELQFCPWFCMAAKPGRWHWGRNAGRGCFDNRVLRKAFGPKRDEVTGEWRKLHNEELNDLYSLPNIVRMVKSRRMRWAGHVACMGEDRGVHRVLVGKPEGKRPLGRPRRR